MKCKISAILLIFMCIFPVHAQKFTLKWSEDTKTKGNIQVLGGSKDAIFVLRRPKPQEMYCRKYNYDAHLIEEQAVNFNLEDDQKVSYVGAFFLKDRVAHFLKQHKRKEDLNSFISTSTDFNLKMSSNSKVLEELPDDTYTFADYRFSKDSTNVLIYSQLSSKRNEPKDLVLKIYDSKFENKLFDKTVQLPVRSKNLQIQDFQIDNFQNTYILARIDKEREEREDNFSLYCYKVFIVSKSGDIKEIKFDYKQNDIVSISLIPGDDGTFICSGFLRDISKSFFVRRKDVVTNEFFNCIIDCKSGNVKSSQVLELEGLYPEKLRNEEDFVPYVVRSIFNRKDGGYVVVAEQYKLIVIESQRMPMNGGSINPNSIRHTERKYYCDVVCININNKSEVETVSRIPKFQLNATNPSILSTYYNDETYIIYEDVEKNIEASDDKEVKRSSKSMFSSDAKNALFIATIRKDGSINKDILFSYKDNSIRPKIELMVNVGKNKIILNAYDTIGVLEIGK